MTLAVTCEHKMINVYAAGTKRSDVTAAAVHPGPRVAVWHGVMWCGVVWCRAVQRIKPLRIINRCQMLRMVRDMICYSMMSLFVHHQYTKHSLPEMPSKCVVGSTRENSRRAPEDSALRVIATPHNIYNSLVLLTLLYTTVREVHYNEVSGPNPFPSTPPLGPGHTRGRERRTVAWTQTKQYRRWRMLSNASRLDT